MYPDPTSLFISDTPLLDVRSPGEFARGAFPASINIPLLEDKQRQQVGKCYKEEGQNKAIETGLRLMNNELREQRLSAWKSFIAKNPQGYLYCFRGGLRSKFTQQWLEEAGVSFPLIEGGYKALRTFLIEQLDSHSQTLPFTLLGGRTGSGKTRLLESLPHYIDLERLAMHRGSSFGGLLTAQPGNIDFENSLAVEMLKKSTAPASRIFLEDEGRLIGRVCIPQKLRDRMLNLPVVLLTEPLDHRVSISEQDYIIDLIALYQARHGLENGVTLFANHHREALHRIRKRFGHQKVERARLLFESGLSRYLKTESTHTFRPYIETLLTEYYDPMYDYQLKSKQRIVLFEGNSSEVINWAQQESY